MEPVQTNPRLTLEQVCSHFQNWRDTRTSRTERIPDDLLAEAKSLLDRYPQSDILRELGLNRQRLLSAESLPSTPTTTEFEDVTASMPFVQIPWPTPEATTPYLELIHTNGMTLRMQDCTEALVAQMVNTFMDHSPCCK